MYYCIANPSARSGGRDTVLPKLLSYFRKQGIPCRLYFTKGPGHACLLARKITSRVKTAVDIEPVNLIVAGGDGTFNEVINGIDNYDHVRLAFLPVGSGNDLARGLDLPKDPSVLIRRIAAGKVRRRLDLGAVHFHTVSDIRSQKTAGNKRIPAPGGIAAGSRPNPDNTTEASGSESAGGIAAGIRPAPDNTTEASGSESADSIASGGLTHRFVISSGIGFDAAVCEEALSSGIKNMLNRFRLGKLSYGTIALRQILFARKAACDILLDDGRSLHLDKMLFSAIMNCAYEGGGYRFAPDADPSDGCMTLVAVGDIPVLKAILSFPAAHAGKYFNIKGVHHFTVQSAEIRTGRPLWVHTDGEVSFQSDHISVKCLPQRLAMLV